MNAAWSLLIVAVASARLSTRAYPGAVTAYECDFEEDSDDDFDGWPTAGIVGAGRPTRTISNCT